MKDFELLPILFRIASERGVSITISFWEPSGEFEFTIISAAKGECGYIKRACFIQQCIDLLINKTAQRS